VNCIETDNSWIPFVSRTSENNGIATYVEQIDDIEPNPAFTLSIAGSGSVLSTFFHDYPYYSWRDLYIAKPKVQLSKQEMLYYCTIIEANKYRYSYGRQANKTLRDILVPSPEEIPESVKNYNLADRFAEKPLSPKKLTLDTKNWKPFLLDELFDIRTRKDQNILESWDWVIPYISSRADNNGVNIYVWSDDYESWNKLTVARNWSVGSAFYHDYNFVTSPDDIRVFEPKFSLNKYIAIFLITLIEKEKYRYAYGRKFGTWRMKETKIKLPITPAWSPDWQWMEEYIKRLPYSASL
jgi:hypothetical protein